MADNITPQVINSSPIVDDANQKQAYEDALDEVHTRFILNLPPEELASADRIMFQLEQAWWFYEDLICDRAAPELNMPRFTNLKPFCKILFEMSPLLNSLGDFNTMWLEFSAYKRKISTYGTILLNDETTAINDSGNEEKCIKIILCQMWNGNTWTLPAGKINQGESGDAAAARETFEETGFDPNCRYGLTKQWKEEEDAIESEVGAVLTSKLTWMYPLRDEDALTFVDQNEKRRTCFVCKGVPLDFPFAPVARKEISKVEWFDLDDLPKKSFAVLPFVGKLKKWIKRKDKNRAKSRDKSRNSSRSRDKSNDRRDKSAGRADVENTKKKEGRSNSKKREGRSSSSAKPRRAVVVQNSNDPLVDAGLAMPGDNNRWSEEDMFKANEELLGRKIDYDGNPHLFAEKGFSGVDPHAFRVVGGSFMNSNAASKGAIPAANPQQYQPLVSRHDDNASSLHLTPFFTQGGETPWGEVVEEAKLESLPQEDQQTSQHANGNGNTGINPGEALLALLQSGPSVSRETPATLHEPAARMTAKEDEDPLDVMTDAQITKRSQQRHKERVTSRTEHQQEQHEKYLQDTAFIEQWVKNLPRPVYFKLKNIDSMLQ